MEVRDIPVDDGKKQFDAVDKGDIVILPAFGATVDEMFALSQKKVQLVDATCPWVLKFEFSGKLVEKTMMRKYGVENINEHFVSFNTICDATQ
ncbi:hypothetical protein B296_00049579, partial [Ensete ventricosum]